MAEQKRILEEIYKEKAAMTKMKEQSEDNLRKSSERSAAEIITRHEQACAALEADNAAKDQELRELRAAIAESKREANLHMQSRAKAADKESALTEKANALTRTMGMESLQFIERDLD